MEILNHNKLMDIPQEIFVQDILRANPNIPPILAIPSQTTDNVMIKQ